MKPRLRFVSVLFAALLTVGMEAFATPNMLLDDREASVISLGGATDLLSAYAPLTRTYSGLYGLASKNELAFNHTFLKGDFSLETIALGVNFRLVPGLKFGAYAKILSAPSFNELDASGLQIGTLDAMELYVGLPIVFDFNSLNVTETLEVVTTNMEDGRETIHVSTITVPKTDGIARVLKQINAGVNLNYYQGTVARDTAWSVFADVNASVRFKAPYIGMPEALTTAEATENEKGVALSKANRAYEKTLLTVENNKKLSEEEKSALRSEIEAEASETAKRLETLYETRKEDIARAQRRRGEIFNALNDMTKALSVGAVEHFMAQTKDELDAIRSIATNASAESTEAEVARVTLALSENYALLLSYKEKAISYAADDEFAKELDAAFLLYTEYANEAYGEIAPTPFSSANPYFKTTTRRVQQGDTWRSIAVKEYGNESYVPYLADFNELPRSTPLSNGMRIALPEKKAFLAYLSIREENKERANKRLGYAWHYVAKGESFESLARYYYDDESRAAEIARYNAMDASKALEAGIDIKIPFEEYRVEGARREAQFVRAKNQALDALRKRKLPARGTLYYDMSIRALEAHLALFASISDAENAGAKQIEDVNRRFAAQVKALAAAEQNALKELKRVQLVRDLALLNATDARAGGQAVKEYKASERELFQTLLRQIYKSNAKLIEELKKEEGTKYAAEKRAIARANEKRILEAKEEIALKRIEAEGEKETLKRVNEEEARRIAEIKESEGIERANAEESYAEQIAQYDWQDYLARLIYFSADEKKDTFAVGVFAKNLGLPIRYGDYSDLLPMQFGVDCAYRFMNLERTALGVYGAFDYSRALSFGAGGGLRLFLLNELFEVSAGALYESQTFKYAAGLGANFTIGITGCRAEAGVVYERIYGALFTVGLVVSI